MVWHAPPPLPILAEVVRQTNLERIQTNYVCLMSGSAIANSA